MIGEATPIYIYWKKAIERLVRYNPNIKLIIVLRNPITRAYSHWNMMRNRNKENLSFVDAIAAEPERLKKVLIIKTGNLVTLTEAITLLK